MTTDSRIGILSSEPVLSGRFMQMANSAAMNPGGTPVASLNNAVNRLGFNLVRTVATAFGRQPDEAMMAGLLHSIGRRYILMHAHQSDPTMRQDPAFAETLETWQPVIGKAILESWGLTQRICAAGSKWSPNCACSTPMPSSCWAA